MKYEKFYNFVKQIAGSDKLLAESVIAVHQSVYDPESLTEGRLRDLAKAGLLAGSLATTAMANVSSPTPETTHKEAINYINKIQKEYLVELDIDTNKAYKNAIKRYSELSEVDTRMGDYFARIINKALHQDLRIAPPIGKQSN